MQLDINDVLVYFNGQDVCQIPFSRVVSMIRESAGPWFTVWRPSDIHYKIIQIRQESQTEE